MTMEIQAVSLSSNMIVLSVSNFPAQRLKPVKIFYILIEADAENQLHLLLGGAVDCNEVGDDFGGACKG